MRTVLTAVVVLFVAVIAGGVLIYTGAYDIGADRPHWTVTSWLLGQVRDHSIRSRAAGQAVPADLDNPALVTIGVEHFGAHCAVCHGAPGVPKGDIAEGMYPQPPNLAAATKRYNDAELFWIIKHGIKMTGMPAWGDHSDDEIWATVAFLQKLPSMTEQQYGELIRAAIASGGHHAHNAPGNPGGASGIPQHQH